MTKKLDAAVSRVLDGEFISMAGGYSMLIPADTDQPETVALAHALAARAKIKASNPWVVELDPELERLVRAKWARHSPGWLEDKDGHPVEHAELEAHFAHSGVRHHVPWVLDPEQTKAVRALRGSKAVATKTVEAYLGFSRFPKTCSLAEAVLDEDGRSVINTRELDTDRFDDDDQQGSAPMRHSQRAGPRHALLATLDGK